MWVSKTQTWKCFGHDFQDVRSSVFEDLDLHSGFPRPKKTLEILGYGFQDMVFRTWDLNFGAWEILGYGFQDIVFKTWDLNFGAWEILGYGF